MRLKISNLSKRHNDKWILRDISFEVSGGEIFGLIGGTDGEKTAILSLINKPEKSAGAEILLTENDSSIRETKIKSHIFPAPENKNFWKRLFQFKANTNESKTVELKSAFEDLLKNADGVLLLDNPFCCLNETLRDEMLGKLRNVCKEKNLCVVFAVNSFEESFAACDRIGVLSKGEIAQIGTARELYEKPVCLAVAAALGRFNFIKANRVSFNNQKSQEFQTLDGAHRLQTDKTEKRLLGAINSVITLAIRPEHISLSFGASFPEDNLLKAKIFNIQYCGATTRVVLDANGLFLVALVLRLVGLNVGDECMVGLPPDRILVLKD